MAHLLPAGVGVAVGDLDRSATVEAVFQTQVGHGTAQTETMVRSVQRTGVRRGVALSSLDAGVTLEVTPDVQHALVYVAGRAPEADATIATPAAGNRQPVIVPPSLPQRSRPTRLRIGTRPGQAPEGCRASASLTRTASPGSPRRCDAPPRPP